MSIPVPICFEYMLYAKPCARSWAGCKKQDQRALPRCDLQVGRGDRCDRNHQTNKQYTIINRGICWHQEAYPSPLFRQVHFLLLWRLCYSESWNSLCMKCHWRQVLTWSVNLMHTPGITGAWMLLAFSKYFCTQQIPLHMILHPHPVPMAFFG